MLYPATRLSFGRILKLTVTVLLLVCGASAMLAQVAPILVPYQVTSLAGNTQLTSVGFGGDGGPGTGAALNTPGAIALDTVGNVYFADKGSDVIREINAQTGVIEIIAGIAPSKCAGVVCSAATAGCQDGVTAAGHASPASVSGLAVDGNGNVFFADTNYQAAWVIFKNGTQVANFIKLVDPTGVTTAGGVLPGYVYHIAGVYNPSTCVGTTTPIVDGALSTTATLHNATVLDLDGAGNIYIADIGNQVQRVINTQATTQSFFGIQVKPGYMAAIMNCTSNANSLTGKSLTTSCSGIPADPLSFGGPVSQIYFWSTSGQVGGTVDQYGNVYETDQAGPTYQYAGAAYAGGAPLAKMINVTSTTAVPAEPSGPQTAKYGDWYQVLNNIGQPGTTIANSVPKLGNSTSAVLAQDNGDFPIRGASMQVDPNGYVWLMDTHYPIMMKFDPNTGVGHRFLCDSGDGYETGDTFCLGGVPAGVLGGTTASPVLCNATTALPAGSGGPATTDLYGNGCPADEARVGGGGTGQMIFDAAGDLVWADTSINEVRKASVDSQFPATSLGTPAYQTLQIHFDQTNLPTMPAGYVTTTAQTAVPAGVFTILPGSPDFTLSTTTPAVSAYPSPAVCTNQTLGQGTAAQAGTTTATNGFQLDNSLDCMVNVTFNPQGPGVRTGILQVTTASGGIYRFGLTGIGSGPQVVIDGGTQTVFGTTGIGASGPGQIAVAQSGSVYIADPSNNRIVVEPVGGAQTAIGPSITIGGAASTLSKPMGVALDAAGNVYIADTGNNRVIKVSAVSGAGTLLGGITAVGVPAYPAMTFSGPQALAVDFAGNVYIADTGNARIVEISPYGAFAPAVLMQYTGAPTLTTPVGIAVDSKGNVYVADSANSNGIIKILAGGGDMQPSPGTTSVPSAAFLVGFGSAPNNNPNGIAVDAAGDIYVSDSVLNSVEFISGSTGAAAAPYALSFSGMKVPGAVALDGQGNVYVADTGNKQVLLMNRTQVAYNFGQVPLDTAYATGNQLPPAPLTALQPLTVTNIGNTSLPILTAFGVLSGTNVGDFTESDTCSTSSAAANFPTGVIGAGLHCTAVVTDDDTTGKGARSAILTAQGGLATVNFSAVAIAPLATLMLAISAPPTAGITETVTVTATQPYVTGNVPTGNITFTYTVDGTAGTPVVVALTPGATTSTASFNLPTLLLGRKYVVNASYAGDAVSSPSDATPLPFYVPGLPVTVSAASVSYTYGSPVPAITGTVTGIAAADASSVSYTFTTAATASTPVTSATNPPYPITVVFAPTAGASNPQAYLNYGFPTVYTTAGGTTPATVTENQYPLKFTINPWSLPYGALPADAPILQVTGANGNSTQNIWEYIQTPLVNGDKLAQPIFTPSNTAVLPVGTYTVTSTLSIPVHGSTYDNINNYAVTLVPGTLTIGKEASTVTVAPAATVELPTAVASGTQTVILTPATSSFYGTPTGTVTITDYFTPIIAASPGVGTPTTTVLGPYTLNKGSYVYVPTSTTLGTHAYYANYSGDSNYLTSFGPSTTTVTCLGLESPALLGATPSQSPSTCLLVDYADFTVTASASPMQLLPGTVPGGVASIVGQSATYPQYESVTVTSVESYVSSATNIINVTCATSAPSWLSCGLSLTYSSTYGLSNPITPVSIGVAGTQNLALASGKTVVFYVQASTPAQLPVNFFSTEVRGSATKAVLAYLPLAALVFLPLAWKSRRRLSKALFLLIALAAISVGTTACQHNTVEFYTPVPLGNQSVTITAVGPGTGPGGTVLPCKNPTASPNDCVNRAFVVPVSVQ
jgi:sugar lactone lactonase YvrE